MMFFDAAARPARVTGRDGAEMNSGECELSIRFSDYGLRKRAQKRLVSCVFPNTARGCTRIIFSCRISLRYKSVEFIPSR